MKEFTELQRLSYVIRAIEIECASLPVGSLKLSIAHELHYNRQFQGLTLDEATNIKNWMHFRQPLTQKKKLELEQADAVFKKDLLE